MPDRQKVIKGLECCMSEQTCRGCPYKEKDECEDGGYYYSKAIEDALTLLKEQEPVLSHEDADGVPHCGACGWVQSWGCNYCDNCGKELIWE